MSKFDKNDNGTQAETELEFFYKEVDESRLPNYVKKEPIAI
jgi:hypothetical protein